MPEGRRIDINKDLKPCPRLAVLEGMKIIKVGYLSDDDEYGTGQNIPVLVVERTRHTAAGEERSRYLIEVMCDPEGNGPGWLHGVEEIH